MRFLSNEKNVPQSRAFHVYVQPADVVGHDVGGIEMSYDIDARSVLDESQTRKLAARANAGDTAVVT